MGQTNKYFLAQGSNAIRQKLETVCLDLEICIFLCREVDNRGVLQLNISFKHCLKLVYMSQNVLKQNLQAGNYLVQSRGAKSLGMVLGTYKIIFL